MKLDVVCGFSKTMRSKFLPLLIALFFLSAHAIAANAVETLDQLMDRIEADAQIECHRVKSEDTSTERLHFDVFRDRIKAYSDRLSPEKTAQLVKRAIERLEQIPADSEHADYSWYYSSVADWTMLQLQQLKTPAATGALYSLKRAVYPNHQLYVLWKEYVQSQKKETAGKHEEKQKKRPLAFKPIPCTPKTLDLANFPIKSIKIPHNWILTEGSETGEFEFHPDGKENTYLRICFDHYPLPGDMHHVLRDILFQEPHDISNSDGNELSDTFPSFNRPNDFEFELVRTVDWNGRKVIETKGEYKKSESNAEISGRMEYTLWYDIYGGGSTLAEIKFAASPEEFSKYFPQAKRCMQSIVWARLH